jgi:hypothetical protein
MLWLWQWRKSVRFKECFGERTEACRLGLVEEKKKNPRNNTYISDSENLDRWQCGLQRGKLGKEQG